MPARMLSALGRFLARHTPTRTMNALDAAAAGEVDELRMHLLREPSSARELRGAAGETALHRAVSNGRVEAAKVLLAHGADVNAQAKEQETPLHLAALDQPVEVLRLLLEAGADVNLRAKGGATALHLACVRGDAALVRALLEAGSALEAVDEGENRPLHRAAAEGHVAVVELLLERGADPTARGYNGLTAESLAALNRRREVVDALQRRRTVGHA